MGRRRVTVIDYVVGGAVLATVWGALNVAVKADSSLVTVLAFGYAFLGLVLAAVRLGWLGRSRGSDAED